MDLFRAQRWLQPIYPDPVHVEAAWLEEVCESKTFSSIFPHLKANLDLIHRDSAHALAGSHVISLHLGPVLRAHENIFEDLLLRLASSKKLKKLVIGGYPFLMNCSLYLIAFREFLVGLKLGRLIRLNSSLVELVLDTPILEDCRAVVAFCKGIKSSDNLCRLELWKCYHCSYSDSLTILKPESTRRWVRVGEAVSNLKQVILLRYHHTPKVVYSFKKNFTKLEKFTADRCHHSSSERLFLSFAEKQGGVRLLRTSSKRYAFGIRVVRRYWSEEDAAQKEKE